MSAYDVRQRLRPLAAMAARRVRRSGVSLVAALVVSLMLPVPSVGANPSEPGQRGQDVDGEAAGDTSGWSVALSADGNTMAIGAPSNDGPSASMEDAGHVRVYRWDGTAWIQRGGDIDGEAAGDESGRSVALSADGNTLAIGAHENDGAGARAGHVRVYRWDGTAWVQRGDDIDGEAAGDRSGRSVVLSSDGNTVAIGAPRNDGAGSNAGHVRIFQWNGAAWEKRGLDIDGEAVDDESGVSVALSEDGDIVAIGAILNDGNGTDAGHVRVYRWDGSLATPAWVERGGDIDGEAAFDLSGRSVALSADGNTVAIGAIENGGAGTMAGHVRVYRWNGIAWVQRGVDIDGEAAFDLFGRSVALSADGDTVAVGATGNDGAGTDAGHVRIYRWDGAAWVQRGADVDGEAAEDLSGFSVALSKDGNTVAIGAPDNDGAGSIAGHVRVFVFAVDGDDAGAVPPPSVTCVPSPATVGASVTCTVAGGDPGIAILWRAAYNPVFAEAGVTLDAAGTGEFSFVVPAAAVGSELTVELVEWAAPVSLGVVGGPVPSSVPSGEGPSPVVPIPAWAFVLLVLAGSVALLRRMPTAS